MATTLVHEPPAAKFPGGDGVRFVAVRANLLPDEIVSGRQLDVVRKQVVLGLLVVVALLIGWYGLSWWQTAAAHSQLDDAQHRTTALTQQQDQFGPLVQAQNETATVRRQLQGLMAYDVPWKTVIASLRTSAPAGVTLSTIAATVNAGAGSTTGGAPVAALPLDQAGTLPIGQIALTGRPAARTRSPPTPTPWAGCPGWPRRSSRR